MPHEKKRNKTNKREIIYFCRREMTAQEAEDAALAQAIAESERLAAEQRRRGVSFHLCCNKWVD